VTANSHITAVPCRANSHIPCCVPAMSCVKRLTVAGRSRTTHLLLIAFVFIFKQTVNIERVRVVSISDKYLKVMVEIIKDVQVGLRGKCIFFVFNISNFMTIRSDMFELFYLQTSLILITVTHSLA